VDKPTFYILHSEMLIKAAERIHAGERVEFKHIRGPREQRFFQAAQKGILCPEAEWPKVIRVPRNRPSQQQYARFLELKRIRDTKAAELDLDPSLIAAKAALEGLAFRPEEATAKLMPWQREVLGV
jgi:ribonuclease D